MALHLLIRPEMRAIQREPLGLLYLAGMDPDAMIWDVMKQGQPDEFIRREKPSVVGVTVMSVERHKAWRILKVAKEAGCITVAGGPHIGVMTKQVATFDYIDYLVVSDGEYPWKAIVDWHDNKSEWQPPRIQRSYVKDLDQLPQPAWDKIDFSLYSDTGMTIGRGCDGHCTFCSCWWVNGKYRHHGEAWLGEALDALWQRGRRHISWEDDCLTNDLACVEILIRTLGKYQFKNLGVTRVDRFDEYTARELSKVGFDEFMFGIESGSQTILDTVRKRTDLEMAFRARELCRKYNIRFCAMIMTGFPFETDETRRVDAEFRKKLAPDVWGSLGHIMVLPGTEIYRQLKKEGKVTDDFWLGTEEYIKLG
ncbi:radical SAM protein [Candidatus Bathyarchaeota archaeon]|nr:radical SAM protein [Candidatus Bathyarchaeota archaeon]